jgi:predicted dinucleotide-binding enzyme
VVAAFQTVSAHDLLNPTVSVDSDVVVCGDEAEAKGRVMALAETVRGVRAVDGGGLANARYVEDLTALLLNINRIYKARSAIKIVGI